MYNNCYPEYYMDRNNQNVYPTATYASGTGSYPQGYQDDRFFLAPFVVGGLAGTALGYGIANNNQINKGGCCMQPVYYYPPQQPMPYMYSSNNFYY